MANPPCQSDDGNTAVFTGTNFDTGQSVMLCAQCLVSFCATSVEGMTGLPVNALLDSASEMATPEATDEDTAEDTDAEDTDAEDTDAEDTDDAEDSATDDDQ